MTLAEEGPLPCRPDFSGSPMFKSTEPMECWNTLLVSFPKGHDHGHGLHSGGAGGDLLFFRRLLI